MKFLQVDAWYYGGSVKDPAKPTLINLDRVLYARPHDKRTFVRLDTDMSLILDVSYDRFVREMRCAADRFHTVESVEWVAE